MDEINWWQIISLMAGSSVLAAFVAGLMNYFSNKRLLKMQFVERPRADALKERLGNYQRAIAAVNKVWSAYFPKGSGYELKTQLDEFKEFLNNTALWLDGPSVKALSEFRGKFILLYQDMILPEGALDVSYEKQLGGRTAVYNLYVRTLNTLFESAPLEHLSSDEKEALKSALKLEEHETFYFEKELKRR